MKTNGSAGLTETEVLVIDNNSRGATKQVVAEYTSLENPAFRYLLESKPEVSRSERGDKHLHYEPSTIVYHPLLQDRAKKEYFLVWWFDYGRAQIREKGKRPRLWGSHDTTLVSEE
jgi:hypothetical protein